MSGYIETAARLWMALATKKQMEAEIANLQDEVLSAGMRAVQAHRESPYNESSNDPMARVCEALRGHLWDDWGLALPDGLCLHDIQYATKMSREQVVEGLDAIEAMCERGYDKTLVRRVVSRIERWRLIPNDEVAE